MILMVIEEMIDLEDAMIEEITVAMTNETIATGTTMIAMMIVETVGRRFF